MPNFFQRLQKGVQGVARGIAQVLGFGREEKPEPKPEPPKPPPEIEQRERDVRSAYEKLRDKYQQDLPPSYFEGEPYSYEEEDEEIPERVEVFGGDVLPGELRPPVATYEAARHYQDDIPLPKSMTEIGRDRDGNYRVRVIYSVEKYHRDMEDIDLDERARIQKLKRQRKQDTVRRQRRQRAKTIKRLRDQ